VHAASGHQRSTIAVLGSAHAVASLSPCALEQVKTTHVHPVSVHMLVENCCWATVGSAGPDMLVTLWMHMSTSACVSWSGY